MSFFLSAESQSRYNSDPSSFLIPNKELLSATLLSAGLVSTGLEETGGSFTPNFHEFYFSVSHRNYFSSIVFIEYEGGVWRYPEVVSFSGRFKDADPFITKCGEFLYFSSTRPINSAEAEGAWGIWRVGRNENTWGEPEYVGFDSKRHERHPSLTENGDLFFHADYGSQLVTFDFLMSNIYVSHNIEGSLQQPTKLSLNSSFADYTPTVSPDGLYIIFASNRPGGFGSSDLYVSYKQENGEWGEPQNMGGLVNSVDSEHYPVICPNGEMMFFSTDRNVLQPIISGRLTYTYYKRAALGPGNGTNDIYMISTKAVGL